MKMKIRYLVVAALFATPIASFYSMDAQAMVVACPGCEAVTNFQGEGIRAQLGVLEASMTGAITTSTQAIVTGIGNLTTVVGAINAASVQQSGDSATQDQINARIQALRSAATPINCSDLSSTVGPRGGSGGGSKSPSPSKSSEELGRAFRAGNGDEIPQPDPDLIRKDAGVGACKDYADPNSARGKICAIAGVQPTGSTGYPDADIQALTLMDGPQKSPKDGIVRNRTVSSDRSDPGYKAAAGAELLLTKSDPLQTPDKASLQTIEGRAYLGLRAQYEAARSLGNYPIEEWGRMSKADPSNTEAIKSIRSEYPNFISKYPEALKGAGGTGVSALTMMELEVEKRIGNEEWMKKVNAKDGIGGAGFTTPEERQKEMMMMQAYSMRMQYMQVVASLQTNMLLGKLLSMNAEQTLRPEIEEMSARLKQAAELSAATRSPANNSK